MVVVLVGVSTAVLVEQETQVAILQTRVLPEEMLVEHMLEAVVVVAQVLWVLLVVLPALVVQEPHPQ